MIIETNKEETNKQETKNAQNENIKFTGNKDVDLVILNQLNDRDLFSICQVNKYISSLCNEDFWKKKFMRKYRIFKS